MLKNTFPYSNNRHIRQLPHILKINLHTRLDDGKDPKPEINDKTKNELKEKIKNELEKDLKFEIGDKTKDELKEKIKNELEKDLKFEIGDKTKNEIKDKIKKEIEDEIDCKRDKNGHDKGDKDKDGFNKAGYDKDGYNKKGFDKDGYNKKGFDEDGYDKDGFDKDGYNKKGFDEDGYDRTGFDKDGYNKKGFDRNGKIKDEDGKIKDDEDGKIKDDEDGKIKDDDGKKKDDEDGKIKDDDGKIKDDEDGKIKDDEDGDDTVIEGKLVSLGHSETEKCGADAEKYATEKQVGKPAWFTKDLLKQFLPELMSNDEITSHFDKDSKDQYHAQNFGITFRCEEDEECGKNIDFTLATPSNMWCNKAGNKGDAGLQCRKEIRSINTSACCPIDMPENNPIGNHNFFLNDECPNLILDLPLEKLKACEGKTIVAKLKSPMVIVAKDNSIVDKIGYKIAEHKYNQVKDKLNYEGGILDSTGKSPEDLEKVVKTIERGLWVSDKEVKLKIPAMPSYSPGANYDEDETFMPAYSLGANYDEDETFLYFDNEAKDEEEVLQSDAEAEKLKIQVQKDGNDEDCFFDESDKEVLLKSTFSHSTQEANLKYYDNQDGSVFADTHLI